MSLKIERKLEELWWSEEFNFRCKVLIGFFAVVPPTTTSIFPILQPLQVTKWLEHVHDKTNERCQVNLKCFHNTENNSRHWWRYESRVKLTISISRIKLSDVEQRDSKSDYQSNPLQRIKILCHIDLWENIESLSYRLQGIQWWDSVDLWDLGIFKFSFSFPL